MGTWTRKALRQRIGKDFLGDMFTSTASATGGATGATLLDTKRQDEDDAFNDAELVILDGTAAGDYRIGTDWVQSTGTFTPDRAFTAQIASGVAYELHRTFTATDKNDAINAAIRDAKWRWARRFRSEVVEFEANTYRYCLWNTTLTSAITAGSPTDAGTLTVGNTLYGLTAGWPSSGWLRVDNEYISYSAIASATTLTLATSSSRGANSSVAAAHAAGALIGVCPGLDLELGIDEVYYDTGLSGTGAPWAKLDDDYWTFDVDNGIPYLQLKVYPPDTDRHVRIVYRARPPDLSSDTDTLDPDNEAFANYVCARASAVLCRRKSILQSEPTRKDFWLNQFNIFQVQADGILSLDAQPRAMGKVIYPNYADSDGGSIDLGRTDQDFVRI